MINNSSSCIWLLLNVLIDHHKQSDMLKDNDCETNADQRSRYVWVGVTCLFNATCSSSGSSGVWGASRCRRVQEADSEGNPEVSNQNVPDRQRRREHAVSLAAARFCRGVDILIKQFDHQVRCSVCLLIDWQVSDLFLWLHWWGEAEDAALFPWLPRAVYWPMVEGVVCFSIWTIWNDVKGSSNISGLYLKLN